MKIAAVVISCGLSGMVNAEILDIIATENENSTRIVLTLDHNQSLSIVQSDEILSINSLEILSYDAGSLQSIKRQGRIKDIGIHDSGKRLTIQTQCNCITNFFTYEQTYLVIDLRDTDTVPTPGHELAARTSIKIVPIWWRTPNSETSNDDAKPNDPFFFPSSGLESLERTIAEDISIATVEGSILEQNPSFTMGYDPSQTVSQARKNTPLQNDHTISTSALTPNPDLKPIHDHDIECETFRTKELFNQEDNYYLYTKALDLRGKLYSESGQQNSDMHIETAVTLLRLGLANEAIQLISQLDTETREAALLSNIAKLIIEGRNGFNYSFPQNCSNSNYFWSTTSNDQSTIAVEELDRLLIYFKALTSPLQTILAKDFSSILARNGFQNAADEIANFMTVSHDQKDITFGKSALVIKSEKTTSEIAQLANRDHPELTIQLLKNVDPTNKSALKEALNLSEAIRHELRGTALWVELLTLESRLSLQSGDFITALSRRNELQQSELDPILENKLVDDIMLYATENAPANVFISIYLSLRSTELSENTHELATNRLQMLGLPHLAGLTNGVENRDQELNNTPSQIESQVTESPPSIPSLAPISLTSQQIENTLRSADVIRNNAMQLISKQPK